MISKFGLRPTGSRSRPLLIGEGPGIPSWFAPEPKDRYEIWKGMGSLESAVLFVQEGTGVVYFTHTQL